MRIKKKAGISKEQFTQVNVFYKGGYKYTVKIAKNSDIIVIYKEDIYTEFFERKEFVVDSDIKMFESEKNL